MNWTSNFEIIALIVAFAGIAILMKAHWHHPHHR